MTAAEWRKGDWTIESWPKVVDDLEKAERENYRAVWIEAAWQRDTIAAKLTDAEADRDKWREKYEIAETEIGNRGVGQYKRLEAERDDLRRKLEEQDRQWTDQVAGYVGQVTTISLLNATLMTALKTIKRNAGDYETVELARAALAAAGEQPKEEG